ncbi:MAG TPA: SDR family oxidoreductase [Rectinemataceae bacterium]|nr:SDR family oxidoreductase [Rectinemataceae bacterium]
MSYIEDLFGLKDRVVVVTGAGGAIAGVMAEAYLRAGAKVALWLHRPEDLAAARERFLPFAAKSDSLFVAACDTGERVRVEAAYDETQAALGHPEVLVNAVGGNRGKTSFVEAELRAFEDILKLNLLAGLVVPTQVFASRWIAAGLRHRSVINMASMGSYVPLSGVWAYDAAKAGVLNLTVACAKEFGSAGIRVNAIAPGFFLGQQNYSLLIADRATGELTPRGKDVVARTPFGRFGDLDELRGAALFLASETASGFVTGISIPVDGGFLADNI